MARRRFEYKVKKDSTFGLNINSMTDMFTIMLVFLLQTYSTSEVEINPVKDLRLPTSVSDASPSEGIRLNLTREDLMIGETSVVRLQNMDFAKDSVESSDPSFIKPLFNQLDKLAKDPQAKAHVRDGKILLQADKDLPYATIRKVMYTASMAGFPQLKLVTIVGE